MKKYIITYCASMLAFSTSWSKDSVDPVSKPTDQDKVQIAILLDTSSSMSGLIDQAKTQLWKMVNVFTDAKRNGKTPFVEVALFEYGNNSLDVANNWIRPIEPLTRDLDEISRELFALTTNGGEEFCGAVIRRSLSDLSWDTSKNTYKVIFIAGNEPFTQGSVDVREACRMAKEKGIVVNSIHCGSREEGIAGSWHDGPALAEGKFLNINQDKAVVHIEAPQDAEIAELGIKINDTYIAYGKDAEIGKMNQCAADKDANDNAISGAMNQRAIAKASANYCNSSWDLLDAIKNKMVIVEKIAITDLPKEMQTMKVEERKAYIESKEKLRKEYQDKILALKAKRDVFVAEEMKKLADKNGEQTLDQVMLEAIKAQAKEKGYEFATPQ